MLKEKFDYSLCKLCTTPVSVNETLEVEIEGEDKLICRECYKKIMRLVETR